MASKNLYCAYCGQQEKGSKLMANHLKTFHHIYPGRAEGWHYSSNPSFRQELPPKDAKGCWIWKKRLESSMHG